MMNKIIVGLVSLFLLACSMSRDEITKPINYETDCMYLYFVNEEGKNDSLLIECPDIKPPRPPSRN